MVHLTAVAATKLFTTVVLLGGPAVQACSVVTGVTTTFYGAPDNDPPGPATAYNCGGRNYMAGGTGTYADPLSFATAPGEYEQCEIVYFPYLRKYLRVEDYCAQCATDYDSGIKHIDIWTGSATSGGDAQIQCENDLTPGATQSVIRAPASNLAVDAGALWAGSSCYTSRTYASYSASTYCSGSSSGSGSTTTTPTTCATGCSWAGHCIGCACETYDDCSDDYVCTSGHCAAV